MLGGHLEHVDQIWDVPEPTGCDGEEEPGDQLEGPRQPHYQKQPQRNEQPGEVKKNKSFLKDTMTDFLFATKQCFFLIHRIPFCSFGKNCTV